MGDDVDLGNFECFQDSFDLLTGLIRELGNRMDRGIEIEFAKNSEIHAKQAFCTSQAKAERLWKIPWMKRMGSLDPLSQNGA